MKYIAITLAVIFSNGCMTQQQMIDKQVGAHQPQEYKDGYMGGCNSGEKAGGSWYAKFTKDVSRYNEDQLYKQGWDDGFNLCKGKYESISRSLR